MLTPSDVRPLQLQKLAQPRPPTVLPLALTLASIRSALSPISAASEHASSPGIANGSTSHRAAGARGVTLQIPDKAEEATSNVGRKAAEEESVGRTAETAQVGSGGGSSGGGGPAISGGPDMATPVSAMGSLGCRSWIEVENEGAEGKDPAEADRKLISLEDATAIVPKMTEDEIRVELVKVQVMVRQTERVVVRGCLRMGWNRSHMNYLRICLKGWIEASLFLRFSFWF